MLCILESVISHCELKFSMMNDSLDVLKLSVLTLVQTLLRSTYTIDISYLLPTKSKFDFEERLDLYETETHRELYRM